MADGRDAADREAGMAAHEVRVRLADRLARQRREPRDIDALRARGHDEQRRVARFGAKHQEFAIWPISQPR